MRPPNKDISTLPKWAQSFINTLGEEVEYWKEQATQSEPPVSEVRIRGLYPHPDYNLPAYSIIIFTLRNGKEIECRVDEQYKGLYVCGLKGAPGDNGSTTLSIEPRASNAVLIR